MQKSSNFESVEYVDWDARGIRRSVFLDG
jgi:hypothetical protein